MRIFKGFLEFDIFGVVPQMYIEGFEKRGSVFGFVITVLCYLAYLILGGFYVSEMFDTTNVNVVQSKDYSTEYLRFNVTSDFSYFSIALENPDTYTEFIDETIYYPKAYFKQAKRDNLTGDFLWEEKEIKISQCSLEDFGIKYQPLFKNKKLSHRYCIKDINQTLYGHFLQDSYSLFVVKIFKCDTSAKGNHCKSEEEINEYLGGTFLSVLYESISIDPNNYKQPATPVVENFYSTISYLYHREMHIFLKVIDIITDKGFLFASKKVKEYLKVDYTQDMFTLLPQNDLAEIQIKLSSESETYKRTYTKIQGVIANFGGASKVIYAVIFVFSSLPTRKLYEIEVVNKLFRFSYGKPKRSLQRSTMIIDSKEFESTLKSMNNFIQNEKRGSNRLNSLSQINAPMSRGRLLRLSQEVSRDSTKVFDNLGLTGREICCFQCLKDNVKRKNVQLLNQGSRFFKEKMDILNIFHIISNYEVLKTVLLDEEQIKMLNFISKPVLYYNRGHGAMEDTNQKEGLKIKNIGKEKKHLEPLMTS